MKRNSAVLLTALALASISLPGRAAGEIGRWWREWTPVASSPGRWGADADVAAAGALRGIGMHGGWYGFWYLDAQRQTPSAKEWDRHGPGVKRLLYYDLGEAGDYAAFFDPAGRMKYTGWSVFAVKESEPPLTPRWFGLDAFMSGADWAPYPTARDHGLPAFTDPAGAAPADLYDLLAARGLDGAWEYSSFSNPRVDDAIARRSGLDRISQRQEARADIQGKTGWITNRLIHVDYANPQLAEYQRREIAHYIRETRPDGIHADNFGDLNLGRSDLSAFGVWSVETFRRFLRERLSAGERARLGIADVGAFDLARYIENKPFPTKGNRWAQLKNPLWTEDPVWLWYLVHKVELGVAHHRAFYEAAKSAASAEGIDCMVGGNVIPLLPGRALMKGACDIAHFEWSAVKGFHGQRAMGLPPEGRVGYIARVGAAIGDAGYCWPSVYVPKALSGVGHENLHKVLAADCLVNRGLLDFGHWFLDGYTPGTPESAGMINRFVRANAARLRDRQYLADIGVVFSTWSQVAELTLFGGLPSRFTDEFSGWAEHFARSHRQWDVIVQEDMTAERMARYPVVLLPAVETLTDEQAAELERYLAGGGRVVATGRAGRRHGPGGGLQLRERNALESLARSPHFHATTETPGARYWRDAREPGAEKQLRELTTFDDLAPILTTDAPDSVGVNLNCHPAGGPVALSIDINNYQVDAETDRLAPAPAVEVTIQLPSELRGRAMAASAVYPEMKSPGEPEPLPPGALTIEDDRLIIRAPSFETCRIVYISLPESGRIE